MGKGASVGAARESAGSQSVAGPGDPREALPCTGFPEAQRAHSAALRLKRRSCAHPAATEAGRAAGRSEAGAGSSARPRHSHLGSEGRWSTGIQIFCTRLWVSSKGIFAAG